MRLLSGYVYTHTLPLYGIAAACFREVTKAPDREDTWNVERTKQRSKE